MIAITPQMKILVAVDPIDGRKGIDALVRICKQKLGEDPFSGCLFIFRNRDGTSIKLLVYDGQGFWLAQKRLSCGRFNRWLKGEGPGCLLEAHQAQMLIAAGDPMTCAAPIWKSVAPQRP